MAAKIRLKAELKRIKVNSLPPGISAAPVNENNLFLWEATINGPPGTYCEGGVFLARIEFTENYPAEPPKMKFMSEMYHPNIYVDGTVCISILHPFGRDPFGYEKAAERWNPLLSIEQILLSVMSMLAEPNTNSPANIEASNQFNNNYEDFVKRAKLCAKKSCEEAARKKIMKETEEEYEKALLADKLKEKEKEEEKGKKKIEEKGGKEEADKVKEKEKEEEKGKKMIEEKGGKEEADKVKEEKKIKKEEEEKLIEDTKRTKRTYDGEESENNAKKLFTVTEEPSIDCGMDTVKIRFTLPIAEATPSHPITRRFLMTDEVSTVLNFLQSQGFDLSKLKVMWSFPPKDLCQEDSKQTLQTLQFNSRYTEVIRLRKKSLDVD